MEKVSIIIPVYNRKDNIKGAEYLREAIESALAQTYENIEVIVVNDGSEDGQETEKVALSYGDKIHYFYKENGGVSSALNFGINKATGDWISWLSHDDLYTSDKIYVQMEDVEKAKAMDKDYKKYLYYCGSGFIDGSGNKINKSIKMPTEGFYEGADMICKMFKGCGIGGCGLLIPKKMFADVGSFKEDMRFSQDWYMWISAFIFGYGLYVNKKAMSITRLHNMQTSTTGQQFRKADREKTAEFLSEALVGMTDSENNNLLKEYMFFCTFEGMHEWAVKIYGELKARKEIQVWDFFWMHLLKIFGKTRAYIARKYYLIRYGIKR